MRVIIGNRLGCPLPLTVATVTSVQTLKVCQAGTVLGFEHHFALEDAIGSHAGSREASKRVIE
jgi:hypothetical protein